MLAYVIALKLVINKDNSLVNKYLRALGYEGLKNFVNNNHLLEEINSFIGFSLDSSLRDMIIENLPKAETIIKKSYEDNIDIITVIDKNYPANLRQLDNCPPVIYVKGKIKADYEKAIGCIGTRNPSDYGFKAIDSLVSAWTKEGFVIVSGLAEGVDTRSHLACLEQHGITIAVLAQGLDNIYPKSNKKLAERIVNSGGMLISEYPVGETPKQYTFVKRNEWIVGLSKAIVVFEAKRKSGTMHSVRFAKLQNKPIFCPVPPNKNIAEAEGVNFLLESNQAVAIKNRFEYGNLIKRLGYSIENNILVERELALIDMKKQLMSMQFFRDKNTPKRQIYISIDESLYVEIDEIAKKHNMTVQNIFDIFRLASANNNKEKRGEKFE